RAGLQLQLARYGPAEELDVLRVGTGPTTLDVVNPEMVELLGDSQLVVDGEGDALALAAVAQRGVEDLYGARHSRLGVGLHDLQSALPPALPPSSFVDGAVVQHDRPQQEAGTEDGGQEGDHGDGRVAEELRRCVDPHQHGRADD